MPTIFSRTGEAGEYQTISPEELKERMERGDALEVIDVREEEEYEIARVEGARLLPLSRFPEWAGTLDPEAEIVFMCHHGIRSARVCSHLAREGFRKLYNLAGGIDAWSWEVDRSVPRY
ncbi:MAG: sulfurtransferase [Pyrinomonadaceae bacterium]|nr:sulfurtransferase [Pyrinomonadaceae bacterium]